MKLKREDTKAIIKTCLRMKSLIYKSNENIEIKVTAEDSNYIYIYKHLDSDITDIIQKINFKLIFAFVIAFGNDRQKLLKLHSNDIANTTIGLGKKLERPIIKFSVSIPSNYSFAVYIDDIIRECVDIYKGIIDE